jgi:hypothetical protein
MAGRNELNRNGVNSIASRPVPRCRCELLPRQQAQPVPRRVRTDVDGASVVPATCANAAQDVSSRRAVAGGPHMQGRSGRRRDQPAANVVLLLLIGQIRTIR